MSTWWAEGRLPITNGVFFDDGRWIPVQPQMMCRLDSPSGGTWYAIHRGLPRGIAELNNADSAGFSAITERIEAMVADEGRNLCVCCGEGSFGGDGFVGLLHADTRMPIWIAFFDNSNPFVSVALTDHDVIGMTNLEHEWQFPIDAPEKVQVRSLT